MERKSSAALYSRINYSYIPNCNDCDNYHCTLCPNRTRFHVKLSEDELKAIRTDNQINEILTEAIQHSWKERF